MYNTQQIMQAQSSSDTDNKTDSDTIIIIIPARMLIKLTKYYNYLRINNSVIFLY